jgi:hypothetical protein
VSLFILLCPEVSRKFDLVYLLHFVSSSKLLPLKLIDVELVLTFEKLLTGLEAAFLSSLESVKRHIAKTK